MSPHGDKHDRHGDGPRRPTGALDDPLRPAIFSREEWEKITQARRLTPCQIKVVGLIVQGKSNKQIHAALKMASSTRRDHMDEAIKRLGATCRNEIQYRIIEVFRQLNG
jgi:DNA-binding NarL/FixJ family response regulator